MVNHEHKFIFLHVPKTAGSSIGHMLWQSANFDARYEGFRIHHDDLTLDMLEEYFVFTFVRNPWDRLWSQYKYRPFLHENYSFDDVAFNIEDCFKEHYKSDVDNPGDHVILDDRYYRANFYGEFIHLPSQTDFLKGKYNDNINKLPYIDYIGKFENLKEDLEIVYEKIGFPKTELLHRNKSNKKEFKHYTEAYSEKAKEYVRGKYKDDIINFSYEF
jgi:hypothetical protein